MNLTIRALAPDDLHSVLALAANAEAPRWSRLDYESLLRADPSDPLLRQGLVALRDQTLCAFAIVSWLRSEPAAELEGLFVDPACRRQGIASRLVNACMDWAAAAGASKIRLEVRASNKAALTLYQLRGFAPTGIRRAYYTAPVEDALLLQADLPL